MGADLGVDTSGKDALCIFCDRRAEPYQIRKIPAPSPALRQAHTSTTDAAALSGWVEESLKIKVVPFARCVEEGLLEVRGSSLLH